MCILRTRQYECPTQAETFDFATHILSDTILCANGSPCPPRYCETVRSHCGSLCPSCSGESPSQTLPSPVIEKWAWDPQGDDEFVARYVRNLFCLMNAYAYSFTPESRVDEFEQHYPTLFFERQCKQHRHQPGVCTCKALGPLGYLYNMGSVLRRHAADLATERTLGRSSPVVQQRAKNPFSAPSLNDSEVDWETNFHTLQAKLINVVAQAGNHVRGRVEWAPLFANPHVLARSQRLDAFTKTNEDRVLQRLNMSPLEVSFTAYRVAAVRAFGLTAVVDPGISDRRLDMILPRLAGLVLNLDMLDATLTDMRESISRAYKLLFERHSPFWNPVRKGRELENPMRGFLEWGTRFVATRAQEVIRKTELYKRQVCQFRYVTLSYNKRNLKEGEKNCPCCGIEYWCIPVDRQVDREQEQDEGVRPMGANTRRTGSGKTGRKTGETSSLAHRRAVSEDSIPDLTALEPLDAEGVYASTKRSLLIHSLPMSHLKPTSAWGAESVGTSLMDSDLPNPYRSRGRTDPYNPFPCDPSMKGLTSDWWFEAVETPTTVGEDTRAPTGEPPVMIRKCYHVVGRRCLFRSWVSTEAGDVVWRCPVCLEDVPTD